MYLQVKYELVGELYKYDRLKRLTIDIGRHRNRQIDRHKETTTDKQTVRKEKEAKKQECS